MPGKSRNPVSPPWDDVFQEKTLTPGSRGFRNHPGGPGGVLWGGERRERGIGWLSHGTGCAPSLSLLAVGSAKTNPTCPKSPFLFSSAFGELKPRSTPISKPPHGHPQPLGGGFGAARLGPLGAGATPRGRGAAALVGLTQSRSSALPSSPGSCSDLVYLSCAQCKRCQQRAEINSRAFGSRGRQAQRRGEENPAG